MITTFAIIPKWRIFCGIFSASAYTVLLWNAVLKVDQRLYSSDQDMTLYVKRLVTFLSSNTWRWIMKKCWISLWSHATKYFYLYFQQKYEFLYFQGAVSISKNKIQSFQVNFSHSLKFSIYDSAFVHLPYSYINKYIHRLKCYKILFLAFNTYNLLSSSTLLVSYEVAFLLICFASLEKWQVLIKFDIVTWHLLHCKRMYWVHFKITANLVEEKHKKEHHTDERWSVCSWKKSSFILKIFS